MREPEDERDPQRTDERRGENRVDRAHVGDDGASTKPTQLAHQRRLEPRAAEDLVARSERPHAAVVGQRARHGAVRDHDDLVHELGERSDLRDRGGKRRMARVDLLRDEDELGHV